MSRDDIAVRLANAILRLIATEQYRVRLGATFFLGVNEVNRLAQLGEVEQENYLTELEASFFKR